MNETSPTNKRNRNLVPSDAPQAATDALPTDPAVDQTANAPLSPQEDALEPEDFETLELEPDVADSSAAGQSGDTQGLSNQPEASWQSVEELVEEGQYFEAAVINGVENAPPPDVMSVKTRQVPEDDVPVEYLEEQDLDVDKGH